MGLRTWSSPKLRLLSVLAVMIIFLRSQHCHWQGVLAARYSGNETDYFALMELKRRIFEDPHGVLNSWNHSVHHCHWQGVTCDPRHQRVTALTLRGQSLFGFISPYLGNLSFLKSIELGENRLYGEIPKEIGRLLHLRRVNVSVNTLTGYIPVNLSYCSRLMDINATNNRFIGQIPKELGSLTKLVSLSLGVNNLTGSIPSSLGNLSSLKTLSLADNNLEGHLPKELGMLTNLSFLSILQNYLSGTFPPSLFNISTLESMSITKNFFHGNLPVDISLKMPNLKFLSICGNQFSGIIPNSIANATKLEKMCLSNNKLRGQVPTNLGNLPNLLGLTIAANLLGENSAEDLTFIASLTNCSRLQFLDFAANNFGGELPKIIGNLSSQLQELYIGGNKISGKIPLELGNLVNLYLLTMEANSFSGSIPRNFGGFRYLQVLILRENGLSGLIPSTIYNITSLYSLQLRSNYFEGAIPLSLQNCHNLLELDLSRNNLTGALPDTIFGRSFSPVLLDLSHNSLTGSLPVEVGRLKNLNLFDVSYNNLSGEIPTTLGDCSSLEYLYMSGNSFRGSVPPTLTSLKGIQQIDLSRNQLTGEIPRDLETLMFLKYLNLSFNDLEGEVPSNGVFSNASLFSLEGNSKLCGGIAALKLHSCVVQRKNNRKFGTAIILVPVLLAVVLSSCAIFFFLVYRRRVRRKRQPIVSPGDDKFISVSFHELHRATEGFSQENLIGSGSFGLVYKGVLDQHGDRVVAVKVLDLQKNGASTSFKAECRALRNIRHRNLVPIITYCSSIDGKGEEFKALVYDFMQNGSLDGWLHPELGETERSRSLNVAQSLNIAIDVASALDYLHNQTQVPIVHCDLKPSNILLDSDLTAHVGDFGLARLLLTSTESSSEQGISSSIAIKGSLGYAAPEYGMGGLASTSGDIYSYGILLLEIFTGRRPTDNFFKDGLDMHNFVKMNFPKQVMEIIHSSIGEESRNVEPDDIEIGFHDNIGDLPKCLTSIFRIGLQCSAPLPKDRMNMNEVMRELLRIKDAFFGATRHRASILNL